MQLRIDRSLPIPISEQVKGQITYAIGCGMLNSGHALPSVRELSDNLEVSPMTIARVYRELSQEGLVVTRPGSGTYVADIARIGAKRADRAIHSNLARLADTYVRHALSLGHTIEEVRDGFLSRLERYEQHSEVRRIGLVGNFRGVTQLYAHDIEAMLRDLNVSIVPMLLCELEEDLDGALDSVRGIKLVIAIPTRLQRVRELLEPLGYTVVTIAFQVRHETRQSLAAIAPNKRVGVVATYPEFLQSLVQEVASYCLSEMPLLYAAVDQKGRVKDLLERIDVLVYASGSDHIVEWLPPDVEAIEYLHGPEPDSVNRLRPLISRTVHVGC